MTLERFAPLRPDEAARIWSGVLDGRFAIVRFHDAGGRRVLAVRAAAGVGLSERERTALALAALGRSNKEIGFSLGVAPSTAAGVLAGAASKLGLRGRRELIALFGAAAAPPRAGPGPTQASPDEPR